MSAEEGSNVRVEISGASEEQRDRWQEAAHGDGRSFSNWARLQLDRAVEQAANNGKEPQDG